MSQSTEGWFADEAFWEAAYETTFPESRFAAASEEVERILALTGQTTGAVLDLACGPGRHSIPLARRGFTVTGVDQSAFLLGKARSRAAEAGVEVEWVRADMRNFSRPDMFDLVLNLFTSFGYFRSDDDNQRVLENVHASLCPGGHFVLDVAGKEVLARIFTPTVSREVPGGIMVQRRQVVDDWSRMENEWMLIEEGSVRSFRFDHWIYSGRELKQMLVAAGFVEIRLFGNLLGTVYGPEATRLIAVGLKSPAA